MNTTAYRVTFSGAIDFEVDAPTEAEAKAQAKLLMSAWLAENAEASDFDVTAEINSEF